MRAEARDRASVMLHYITLRYITLDIMSASRRKRPTSLQTWITLSELIPRRRAITKEADHEQC